MPSDGSSLLFQSVPRSLRFEPNAKRSLKTFAQQLSERLSNGLPFCCLITNDETLRKLNRDFRNKDYATDVLSFPSVSASEGLGELAVSAERAAHQAEQYGHPLLDELRILMLHGVLHLAGMDHESDSGEMARAERKLRAEFGLPAGLIARSRAPRRSMAGGKR
jgi:probable rRNA maturation factor